MELPDEPMTVASLTVDNFQRIRAARVTPSPTGLIPVRGANAQGKSALLGSMLSAFGVERPGLPITEGEHGSHIVTELANEAGEVLLTVKEHWTRDSAGKASRKLSIESADGTPVGTPATTMKKLVGFTADPAAFLEMSDADQVKTVLAVLGLADQLEVLESDEKGFYDRRRDLGRENDRLSKAAVTLAEEVSKLPESHGGGSVEELTAQLTVAQDSNAAICEAEAEAERQRNRWLAANENIAHLEGRLKQEREYLEEAFAKGKEAAEFVAVGQLIDTGPILDALAQWDESAKHAGRRELSAETTKQAATAKEAYDACDKSLNAKRAEINELLSGAKFPVDGMTYDPEAKVINVSAPMDEWLPATVRVAGGDAINEYIIDHGAPPKIPLASASQGERLRIAAAVAMAGKPLIKAIFVREGSLIDSNGQMILDKIARQYGFQLWFEIVDAPNADGTRASGIWIEDGEAFEVEEA